MNHYLGIDIGGTKCAVIWGNEQGNVLEKRRFPTTTVTETLENIMTAAGELMTKAEADGHKPLSIGVSCGSPLDSKRGIIKAPPNLPDWVDIHITDMLTERFGIPAYLCNDANACALAEWRFGAGKGTRNMIFCTFGTGFGAGLILDGKLYAGTADDAGEIGHVRLDPDGPVGYYKAGSVEGFCSGGGLRQLGQRYALDAIKAGKAPSYCPTEDDLPSVTALSLANAAHDGDPTALAVWNDCGDHLGRAMAILIDLFNPECIVIGSIFARSGDLLIPTMQKALAREALPTALTACRIIPAALTESVGDLAALTIAMEGVRGGRQRETS